MQKSSLKRSAYKAAVLSAVMLLIGCAAKKPAVEHKPWGTFLFNESRSNVNPDKVNIPLALSWKTDLSDFKILRGFPKEQLSSPAVANGVLYIGSTNRTFYSFDLSSGKVLWEFDAGYPIEAPPAVRADTACFGSSNGVLRCFDAATGKPLWQFQARSEVLSSPIVTDDRVYFSSSDDRVYALSLKTGEKLWSYTHGTFQTVAPRIYGSPAYSGNRLFQLFSDGYVVCLSSETGKEVWIRKVVKNFDSAQQTRRTPLVDDGLVYVIDDNFSVEALDAQTGEVKNIYNIIKTYDFIVPDKRTLILAGSEQIIAFDRITGSILWKKELARKPLSSIFAADEYLFVLSNYRYVPLGIDYFARQKGYVEAIKLKTGETVWAEKLKSSVTANGSSAEMKIAVLTNKGILEVFGGK